jgi:hypothetical protein
MKVACPLTPPHVTSIGHVPTVVLAPTVQLQVATPVALEIFGTSPCAELGPLLYVTVIAQETFGAVETVTAPVPLRDTGDRTDVKMTPTGFAVGATVAGARVAGACVTGAAVTGAAVAGAAVPGAGVASVVEGTAEAVGADGAAVTAAELLGTDFSCGACAPGTMPASRVAAVPHPASANRRTQLDTVNRFPKSHPSPI